MKFAQNRSLRKIICTVTNDLTYDQRMIRICTSLTQEGYQVSLVGFSLKKSLPIKNQPFTQKRLFCFFKKGPLFYIEYNIRLFFYLWIKQADCLCAIDLDTILPVLLVSKLKKTKRVYDAHELFCEMKEIVTRPSRYKFWKRIEQLAVPQFPKGYTVCTPIAEEFKRIYGVNYEVIRNVPFLKSNEQHQATIPDAQKVLRDRLQESRHFIYQGAVNQGRSFETLIPAMKNTSAQMIIVGDGNYFEQTKALIAKHKLEQKVILTGKLQPEVLHQLSPLAFAGLTLFENNGLSNYYSLANRFFDYIHAGIPQICVNYPAYQAINAQYDIAIMIEDTNTNSIVEGMQELLSNPERYQQLKSNCLIAQQSLNWQVEQKKLSQFYASVFG